MDLGMLFGFAGTWALICWALLAGGNIGLYFDMPSVILIFGASCTVIFFAFPAKTAKGLVAVVKKAFFHSGKPLDGHSLLPLINNPSGGEWEGPAVAFMGIRDGNFGGAWQKPDDEMLALWRAGVEETREALEGPWPTRS